MGQLGIDSRRFRILKTGMLFNKLATCQKVIVACCCLNNIALELGEEEMPPEKGDPEEEEDDEPLAPLPTPVSEAAVKVQGQAYRDTLLRLF